MSCTENERDEEKPMDKVLFCPLQNAEISQYDCDEIACAAEYGRYINDGLPPLIDLIEVKEKREICLKCDNRKEQ